MEATITEMRLPESGEVLAAPRAGEARVRLGDGEVIMVRSAIPGALAKGDEVLVSAGAGGQFYLIGVLRSAGPRRLVLAEGDELEVFDARGELVFHHGGGRTRMTVPRGNLEIAAPDGTVSIRGRDVDIAATARVRVEGDSLESEVRTARFVGDRIESVFRSVVSKADRACWKVGELARLFTGRLRVRTEGSCQMTAETTSVRSEKDTRIDGEHVLLG